VRIRIEEVTPFERVVWSAKKKGLAAYHEFIFGRNGTGVVVTSRETFTGILSGGSGLLLPAGKMRALTVTFLQDLKRASEP
jgi:hypothetical protein